jgi:hypothetical protein
MALLSQMIRTAAITGRTDNLNAWFADRQGGRWAEQTVRSAFPASFHEHGRPPVAVARPPVAVARQPANAAAALRDLTELHESGVVSDAEFERLRSRLAI